MSESCFPTEPELFLECFFLGRSVFWVSFLLSCLLVWSLWQRSHVGTFTGPPLSDSAGLRIYGKGRTDAHSGIAYGLFL